MADDEPSYETPHSESTSSKKHKKKKKKPSSLADEPTQETQHDESSPSEKHKSKKKKSRHETHHDDAISPEVPKSKKHKSFKLKLEAIPDDPNRMPPVVGYFPSGYKPNKRKEGNTVDLYRHVNHPNRLEAVVRPKNSNVEFVGTSYSGEAAAPQVCTYALGVFDKEEKTLKILPIAANKILRFEPRVMRDDEAEPSEGLTQISATEKGEKRIQDLTSVYGTKKDKTRDKKFRTLNELKNYNVGEAKEFLKNQENQESESEVEMSQTSADTFRNIPPFNPDADVAEKIYDLDKIIPSVERPYLLDILNDLGGDFTNYPSFVAKRVNRLNKVKYEERETLACILSYITYLHAIYDRHKPSKQKKETKKSLKIPREVRQRLTSLFVDPESNLLSSEKSDLLIGYILVLTLFVDKFKTDPTDIAKDLMMTAFALRPFYMMLGCKLEYQAGRKGLYTLRLPLEFPDMRRKALKGANVIK